MASLARLSGTPFVSDALLALRARMLRDPERTALVESGGRHLTYAELIRQADEFAAKLGVERRLVFLEAGNEPSAIAAYLGCILAGHPVYLFSKQDGAVLDALAARYRPDVVVRPASADPLAWQDAPRRAIHPELALLLSTSGSTGSPKFVKLSASNLVSNAHSIAEYLRIGEDDRAATALGFNYSYGLSVVNSHLFSGASLLLEHGSVIDSAFWRNFATYEATSFAGVPYSFEMLAKGDGAWAALPRLKHVTQAGGALSPQLVRHFAGLGRENGWRFYVMYGQTECAPRIAYLPPDMAERYPEAIGVPIPGGQLAIRDERDNLVEATDTPGELVYSGPNVMMGYAADHDDLATGEPPREHRTGDIGCRNEAGLFYIVGRLSRFVKPFGLRVNLDELQANLRPHFPELVCTGTDSTIVLAAPAGPLIEDSSLLAAVTSSLKLPASVFRIVRPKTIPLLSNQKPDYAAIKAMASADPAAKKGAAWRRRGLGIVFSAAYLRQVLSEVGRILGLDNSEWHGVRHIYATLLDRPEIAGDDTFVGLSGDSLSYVQTSIALEQYLGHLPGDWENMSVDQLEQEAPVGQAF